MKRRTFLQATLVTAGGLALGSSSPGCADDEASSNTDQDAVGSDSDGDTQVQDTSPPTDPAQAFPQSVASGDPTASSVILWTRVNDPSRLGEDLQVTLEVASDPDFAQLITLDGAASLTVTAEARFDHCVKVRVAGLQAATKYYYRFTYAASAGAITSRVARTNTAPAPTENVAVRFAFVSCQDYNGRYYNAYKRLATEEVDFVLHLGDYIYETTGDPSFQTIDANRRVSFRDPAGAIVFNEGTETEYLAAATLDQYRDLYRTFRGDKELQSVHERFPFVVIWDDHEFSDDCWGINTTYFGDDRDGPDAARRQAANQAWFEYQPVDYQTQGFRYDADVAPPNDIQIYRDFVWGRNLHLFLIDGRSYRGDHPVPEDAFPGAIAVDQATLTAKLGGVPEYGAPYVDIATYQDGDYANVLKAAAEAVGYDAGKVTGNIAAGYINQLLEGINEGKPEAEKVPPIPDDQMLTMERGLAYFSLNKSGFYSGLGARQLVRRDTYDVYTDIRWDADPDSEVLLGQAQRDWLVSGVKASQAIWKVIANPFMLMPLQLDLSQLEFGLPDFFKQKFYLLADDWVAARHRRDALLTELAKLQDVVAVTGDVHAFFAGNPMVNNDPSKRIVELVTSGISSSTLRNILLATAKSDPALNAAGAPALASLIEGLLLDPMSKPNPHLAYAQAARHGVTIVEAGGSELNASQLQIDSTEVTKDLTAAEVAEKFTEERFRVNSGSPDLFQEQKGVWMKWDPVSQTWV